MRTAGILILILEDIFFLFEVYLSDTQHRVSPNFRFS